MLQKLLYRQSRARRVLSIFKDVLLRTRSGLSLYKVYGDSALLVLNRTSMSSDSALLALNWWYWPSDASQRLTSYDFNSDGCLANQANHCLCYSPFTSRPPETCRIVVSNEICAGIVFSSNCEVGIDRRDVPWRWLTSLLSFNLRFIAFPAHSWHQVCCVQDCTIRTMQSITFKPPLIELWLLDVVGQQHTMWLQNYWHR